MPYSYTNNLYNTGVFEFEAFYSGDLDDLNVTGSGSGVHLNRDVTIDFGFIDKVNTSVNSTRGFLENPFISGLNIDILDVEGTEIYPNYLNGYKRSSFTFNEEDNSSVFGSYAKNFGIRANLIDTDGNEYSSEFFFYGNSLEITGLTITDQTGTHTHDSSFSSKVEVTPYTLASPTSGELFLEVDFLNGPEYTDFDYLSVYWGSGSGQFTGVGGLNDEFLAKKLRLNNFKQQTTVLNEGNLPELDELWLTAVPYSNIGSGQAWTVGPYQFKEALKPEDPFASKEEAVLVYGDQTASGNKTFVGEETIVGGSGHAISTGNIGNNIAGGRSNTITGESTDYNFIGGGQGNNITSGDFSSSIGGSDNDIVYASDSVIAGGSTNRIEGDSFGTLEGDSEGNFIGGGTDNSILLSDYSSSVGGFNNDISESDYSTIIGGLNNDLANGSDYSLIGGGFDVTVTGSDFASSLGGRNNDIGGSDYSINLGGRNNLLLESDYGAIVGGSGNLVTGSESSTVIGGTSNEIDSSPDSYIIGSYVNINSGDSIAYFTDSLNSRTKEPTGDHSLYLDYSGGVEIVTGEFTTRGGRVKNTARYTSSTIFLVEDEVIFCNTNDGSFTGTLTSGFDGLSLKVVNSSTSGNQLTISPSGSQTLFGENSDFDLLDGESLDLTYNAIDGWY